MKSTMLAMILSCLTVVQTAYAQPALSDLNDPNDLNEAWNRQVFSLNLSLDDYVLAPVADAYEMSLPEAGRLLIHNELDYLSQPQNFVNALLQGNIERTGEVLGRFLINTTFGGLGLLDPATEMGLPSISEDFGQTLSVWGVGEGFFWMAPVLGPSSARDIFGRCVDLALKPASWTNIYVGVGQEAVSAVTWRQENGATIDGLRSSSTDYYATVRSLYRQKRNGDIMNRTEKDDLQTIDFDTP